MMIDDDDDDDEKHSRFYELIIHFTDYYHH